MTKHGRPELAPEDRRAARLPVRFLAADIARFRECAERQGLTLSEWARFWLAQGLEADRE